jgi:hypothetical protein
LYASPETSRYVAGARTALARLAAAMKTVVG